MSDEQEQEQPPAQQGGRRRAAAPVFKRGQLVQVSFRDEVTGVQLVDRVAVVTRGSDAGGHLLVRPLADHDFSVDPAEVEPVVVDEV